MTRSRFFKVLAAAGISCTIYSSLLLAVVVLLAAAADADDGMTSSSSASSTPTSMVQQQQEAAAETTTTVKPTSADYYAAEEIMMVCENNNADDHQCVAVKNNKSTSFSSSSQKEEEEPSIFCANVKKEEDDDCVERAKNYGCIRAFDIMRQECPATCLLCSSSSSSDSSSSSHNKMSSNNTIPSSSTTISRRANNTTNNNISNNNNKKDETTDDDDESSFFIQRIYNAEPQRITSESKDVIQDYTLKMDDYMYEQVYQSRHFSIHDRVQCQNRHELCTYWAATTSSSPDHNNSNDNDNECNVNPQFMKLACAPACFSCDELIYRKRCPVPTTDAVWKDPGDLNAMFEHIVSDPEYNNNQTLTILSRPRQQQNSEPSETHRDSSSSSSSSSSIPPDDDDDGPWLIVIDDFLTPAECETMIALGHEGRGGYERSTAGGPLSATVVTQGRTSSTAWCDVSCSRNATTRTIMEKIGRLTMGGSGGGGKIIPDKNAEHLQLLRYNVGEFYSNHHDFVPDHLLRPPGPRILTVFIYLNTVEAGGGTHFTQLNMTVEPKRGRVVVWPNVLDESPNEMDERTNHAALPVEKGVKYGANAWIHQRDFKTPHAQSCI